MPQQRAQRESAPDTGPASFLIFITDQNRWDLLGCAGHPTIQTPNLDGLAERGIRFDRHYTIHPLCMPTRGTMLTGLTPRGHGTRCNGIPLTRDLPTITQALVEAGYRTHGIGKLHYRPFGTLRGVAPEALDPGDWLESRALWETGRVSHIPVPYYGFESVDYIGGHGFGCWGDYVAWLSSQEPRAKELWQQAIGEKTGSGPDAVWQNPLPPELHYTAWIGDQAIDFVRDRAQSGQPFFLWCSFPDPHPPYTAAHPWGEMYSPADVPPPITREGELDSLPPHYRILFDEGVPTAGRFAATNIPEAQIRRVRAMAYGMISQIDHAVGRVLHTLDELGLRQSTVVAFLADHGNMMGDHGLMNMPPTHLDGTTRVPSIWSLPGRFAEGQVSRALVSHLDFAPTILDVAGVPTPEGAVPLTPEAPRQLPPWPGSSMAPVLRGEEDTIEESVIIENDEDYLGMRMRTLVTDRYHLTTYAGEGYGELFDLREDPEQLHNLWDDPERQQTKLELRALLQDRLTQTDNVLPRRLCHA
jgi:arylsulfatase A-like enzyme